jgi:hypothetical protein
MANDDNDQRRTRWNCLIIVVLTLVLLVACWLLVDDFMGGLASNTASLR